MSRGGNNTHRCAEKTDNLRAVVSTSVIAQFQKSYPSLRLGTVSRHMDWGVHDVPSCARLEILCKATTVSINHSIFHSADLLTITDTTIQFLLLTVINIKL